MKTMLVIAALLADGAVNDNFAQRWYKDDALTPLTTPTIEKLRERGLWLDKRHNYTGEEKFLIPFDAVPFDRGYK